MKGLSKEEIAKKRATIPPVANRDVQIHDSDDEEYKKDLLCRRRLERPGSGQLHVSELLELAEANVPNPPAHDEVIFCITSTHF